MSVSVSVSVSAPRLATAVVLAVTGWLAGCDIGPAVLRGSCTASPDACTGQTPVCGADDLCRGCIADEECASSACLEDGRCADATSVIYAAPNGTSSPGCGRQLGMNECSLAQAALEVDGVRTTIRLRPGTYGVTGQYQDFPRPTVLVARGSTIDGSMGTAAVLNTTGQALTLIGGTITRATTDGVQCDAAGTLRIYEALITDNTGSGVETESCKLVVSRTAIRRNRDGGIKMSSTPVVVEITNNFVYGNGQSTSKIGGMTIDVAAGSKVEFNTVVDNISEQSTTAAGGIKCTGNYDLPSNIVYRNAGGVGNQTQVIGTCTSRASYVMAAALGENAPGFEAPNDPAKPSYRLTKTSPPGTIRDAVACTGVDFEGDVRPAPDGGTCDYGADEYRDGQ